MNGKRLHLGVNPSDGRIWLYKEHGLNSRQYLKDMTAQVMECFAADIKNLGGTGMERQAKINGVPIRVVAEIITEEEFDRAEQ